MTVFRELTTTTMQDIDTWLEERQLGHYRELFAAQGIGLDMLDELSDTDLRELGMPLGDRKRLLRAIALRQVPPLPTAERRQLTVMFVDLVDSTPLTQRLDPEELRLLFQSYQNVVAGEITRYQGYPAQFLGDGVMAYFGWPRTYEDAAERAVRAGLAVARAVPRLSTDDGVRLAVRVSIATGPVVVGDLLAEHPTHNAPAVGETPHRAARLQSLAGPGEVVIGEVTRRLLGNQFELAFLGERRLRGIALPEPVHRVDGERPLASRFEARAMVPPLVGRDGELAALEAHWRRAMGGERQLVVLEGEAGIGKSRVCWALLERLAGEDCHQVLWQCSPYHTSNPLYPVARYLWRCIGLRAGHGDAGEIRRRVGQWLAQMLPATPDSVARLAELLGSDGAAMAPRLSSQEWRTRILEVLIQWLLGQVRRRPLLLMVEDLQWLDPSTRELLSLLLERADGVGLLLVATSRPVEVCVLDTVPPPRRLHLGRLERDATLALLDSLCKGKQLPAAMREEIGARTDGVPLFVEELTRAVLESELLRETDDAYELNGPWRTLDIPQSLQDSLLARLDRLADGKSVAQTAACIGREFSREVLRAVIQWPPQALDRNLDRLCAAGLLERRGVEPPVFGFRHALIRDAAYQSLLKSHRQQLHAHIATVLEERFPARVVSAPQLLAYHFAEAGLAERSVQYWMQAAQRSLGQFANEEALDYAEQGLVLLGQREADTARDYQELVLQFTRGAASRIRHGYAAAPAELSFQRALTLARELNEQGYRVESARGLWSVCCVQGRLAEGASLGEQVLGVARDDHQRMLGHYMSGVVILLQGETAAACQRLEKALSLYAPHQPAASLSVQSEPRIYLLAWLGLALGYRGLPRQGIARAREAVASARQQSLPLSEVDALVFLCNTLSYYREPLAEEARALAMLADRHRMVHYQPLARFRLAMDVEALDPQARLRAVEQALDQYRQVARVALPGMLAQLASVALKAGAVARAEAAVVEGLAQVQATGERQLEAELHRVRGVIRLRQPAPDPGAAEVALQQALAIARHQQTRLWELRAAMSLARLWLAQDRQWEARELLTPLLGCFETDEAPVVLLRRARSLLASPMVS